MGSLVDAGRIRARARPDNAAVRATFHYIYIGSHGERASDVSPSGQSHERAEKEEARSGLRFVDLRVALAGGALTAAVTFGTMYALGSLGPLEAQGLLQGTLPTIRFLCSTAGTASATILALMLSIGMLLILVVPLSEAEKFPTSLFDIVYYGFIALSALLGGMMVSLVVMLLNAIYGVIDAVRPGAQSPVVATEENGS